MTSLLPALLPSLPTAIAQPVDDTTEPSGADQVWTRLGDFATTFQIPLTILAIIVGAVLARIVLHFVIRRVVNQVVTGVKKRQNVEDTQAIQASPLAAVRVVQRTRTLGSVLNNIVSVVVVIVALLLIVTEINENIIGSFALITAALGAGLGFGAQNIVKDVLNGLFMVAEDQLGVGDVVDLGPATGVVETVGIRITAIRSVDGTLWFVRNGEVLRVGNKSLGWARAIIDLAIPYTADVHLVQDAMLKAAIDMWESREWRSRILEKPEIWGIESISAEALVVRLVVKTRAPAKDDVARELRLRLKFALDELGVELPALNTIVLNGLEVGAPGTPSASAPMPAPEPPKKPRATRTRSTPVVGATSMSSDDSAPTTETPKAPRATKGRFSD